MKLFLYTPLPLEDVDIIINYNYLFKENEHQQMGAKFWKLSMQ